MTPPHPPSPAHCHIACTPPPTPTRARHRTAGTFAGIVALLASAAATAQSYRVHPWPIESPSHGARALVTAPHDPVASPFGWHDTNGVPGPEFTTLRGNNAHVYMDVDSNSTPDGPGPEGGAGLVFDHAVNFASPPLSYSDALATNAFYWTNRLHDIFQRHGFTPARGNMQANNYGLGGLGNDPVKVEILKGGGVNNVSHVITADGSSPSIRHYLWNTTTPNRESSFDAGTHGWAYTLLMHRRLIGTCTEGSETPSIGYADLLGLLVTTDFHIATPTAPRGLGTYVLGQPTNGAGIRTIPYSTDMSVFPRTYANLPTLASPHATGSVWAGAMWDLVWAMVARYGASHDLLTGNGAENRILRLAIEGMNTMQCPAGFVSARNSILAADQTLHGGADRCMIWKVFARRGLGADAQEGSPNSILDQVVSFAEPVECDRVFAHGFE